ncbi:hypothetical protein Tco_0112234 [Tanacetum coccineum]
MKFGLSTEDEVVLLNKGMNASEISLVMIQKDQRKVLEEKVESTKLQKGKYRRVNLKKQIISKEKVKGVDLKNVEDNDDLKLLLKRSTLDFKALPKIDPTGQREEEDEER